MIANFIITLAISLGLALFLTFQIMPKHIASQIQGDVQDIAKMIEKQQLSDDVLQNELFYFSLTNIHYQTFEHLQQAAYLSDASKKRLREGRAVEGDTTSKEMLYIYPVMIDGEQKYLEFTMKQTIYKDLLKRAFVLLSAITFFVGLLLNILTSIQIIRPIQKLTSYTKQFSKGNFAFTAVHTKHYTDEINQLYESFGSMSHDLENMLQSQKDFVSNISHEFQTPLTSINGFSKALQQKKLSREKQLHYLQIIEHESARLSQLSRNVLKLSSLQNDTQPLEIRAFDLAEQLRQVIISLEPRWVEKEMDFRLSFTPSIIEADEMLLYQVWYNLINNAIQFSPFQGAFTITIEQQETSYMILLEDEGPGIEEAELLRVKEPFYKAKNLASSGNGLGLSIVENIVRKHAGTFELMNYSQGLRTVITLPIKQIMKKSSSF